MKFKKIFLVSLILLTIILAANAVSASDNITSDTLTVEETDNSISEPIINSDDEILSANNDSGMKVDFVTQDENKTIHVIDKDKDIYVNDHDSDYFRVKFPKLVTGQLSLYIDGNFIGDKEIFAKTHYLFVNSKSYKLGEGNHTWMINYSGDDDYASSSANGTFTLNPPSEFFVKKNSNMEISVVTKDINGAIFDIDAQKDILAKNMGTDYFKVKFPKLVSGTLYLYIDGKLKATKKIKSKNHYFYANSENYNLKKGKHNWEIKYSGDDEYNATSANGTFIINVNYQKVNKITTSIKVPKTKTFKTKLATKKYTATFKANKKAFKKVKVYITIKGKKYKKSFSARTNNKGQATFKITKLNKPGTYSATVLYKGNKTHRYIGKKLTIKITKTKTKIIAGNTIYHNDSYYEVGVLDTQLEGIVEIGDGYNYVNEFRLEKNVWQWNKDNNGKTFFNTNSSNTLKALEIDTKLEEIAKIRAEEASKMYDKTKQLTHDRPDNSSWDSLYPLGNGYNNIGENLAVSQTPKGAIEQWKETNNPHDGQGHRRNMLSPNFNSIGMAGYKNANGKIFWAQSFGNKYSE